MPVDCKNEWTEIEGEITGYLSNDEFVDLISNEQMVKKGCKMGIPMQVDNFYVCAAGLKPAENFANDNF